MSISTLFFDLDDTLYESGNGLWNAIRDRMSEYMAERLGLAPDEIPVLRRQYYETYGTTLRGLQKHFQVDADDYLAYVHDLPLDAYLHPDPRLRELLLSLPQHRWVFTNADAAHAGRVLQTIGVSDCFEGIIDVRAIDFACKPEREAYLRAMALANESDPRRCALLDDSPVNLAGAHELGMVTILVGRNGAHLAANYTLPDIYKLREVMPQLWKVFE
jgi:putative hydrolase of the HAD superfamily